MFSEISAGRRDLRRARPSGALTAVWAAALALSLCAGGGAVFAQEPPGGGGGAPYFDEKDFLDEEAEQAIRDFLAMVGPALRQLETLIQDLPAYDPPEMLPNGDIIIRRRRGWGEGPRDDAPERDGGDGDGGNGWTKT